LPASQITSYHQSGKFANFSLMMQIWVKWLPFIQFNCSLFYLCQCITIFGFFYVKSLHRCCRHIQFMKRTEFLRTRTFLKHLGLAVVATVFLFWISLQLISLFTRHGSETSMPVYIGRQFSGIDTIAPEKDFEFIITDSIYDENKEPGTIIIQDPPPFSKVKDGRKVYITVVASVPEMVDMPNLIDLSLRQAMTELNTRSLRLNNIEYIPHFAQNTVRGQKYHGRMIQAGTEIPKGSKIDLVLGDGHREGGLRVPFLVGKTHEEAMELLVLSSLNLGTENFIDSDNPENLRVYRQDPPSGTQFPLGGFVNLWYRSSRSVDFDSLIRESELPAVLEDSLEIDSLEYD